MALGLLIRQVQNLINDLLREYPDDKDLIVAKSTYEIAASSLSEQVLNVMILHVYKYKKEIFAKNEKFFLTEFDLKNHSDDKDSFRLEDKIKTLWKNHMTDDCKEVIWKYFKVFCVLIEKILAQRLK